MREQEKKLKKVKASCKTAQKVTKIFMSLTVVGSVLCIAGAAGLFLFREQINPALAAQSANITFSDVSIDGILHFDFDVSELITEGLYAQAMAIYCSFAAIVCGFVAFLFGTLRRIFSVLEESESPFSEEVLGKLKAVFILFTVITALFEGIGIAILAGISFWCIYCILDYGTALQTEVDETL